MGKSKAQRDAETFARALAELRRHGLRFPGAQIKTPWPGHEDLAVNDKTFCYLPPEGGDFSIGCKLPHSGALALMLPFCQPTRYGLGKSGWVTATPAVDQLDLDMFKEWIEESYRAQAPKKWVEQIGMPGPFGFDEDPFVHFEGPSGAAATRTTKRSSKQAPKPSAKQVKKATKPPTKQPTRVSRTKKPARVLEKPAASARTRAAAARA